MSEGAQQLTVLSAALHIPTAISVSCREFETRVEHRQLYRDRDIEVRARLRIRLHTWPSWLMEKVPSLLSFMTAGMEGNTMQASRRSRSGFTTSTICVRQQEKSLINVSTQQCCTGRVMHHASGRCSAIQQHVQPPWRGTELCIVQLRGTADLRCCP